MDWTYPDEVWWACLHEAGHAVVAMAHGKDIVGIKVNNEGGGFCDTGLKGSPRSYHAYSSLAGYYAVALFATNAADHYRSWETLKGPGLDLDIFNNGRMGASFRHARREVLALLRERKHDVLELAGRLYRYGRVDSETPP